MYQNDDGKLGQRISLQQQCMGCIVSEISSHIWKNREWSTHEGRKSNYERSILAFLYETLIK